MTLEDETGLVNVTVRPDLFHEENAVLVSADVLEVDGVLQTRDGCSVRAVRVRPAAGGRGGHSLPRLPLTSWHEGHRCPHEPNDG